MPRAFLQRSRPRLLTAAAWSGLRPAPESRSRGAHPHLPRSCTTPVYLMLPPFCVSLQHTEAEEVERLVRKIAAPICILAVDDLRLLGMQGQLAGRKTTHKCAAPAEESSS